MREALGFLTVFGGARAPSPRALRWFPIVGAAVGAAVGAVWWLADQGFPVLLAAALAVTADAAITGMLHLDGLADAADGLLPHAARDRRLEIMRTGDVGAFGIVVVAVVVILRFAALASRPAEIGLLAGVWCASRTVVAVAPAWLSYVRDEGIASPFVAARVAPRWPALGVVAAAALAGITAGVAGLVATAVTILGAIAVLVFARARLGGFTGDVLGAAIVAGETLGLLVAAARS